MSLSKLTQALMDAAQAEGIAYMTYEEEADRQPFIEKTQKARVALEAVTGELLAALQWHEQFKARKGEHGSSFERVAESFHKDTGYLAPGKDCRVHDPEVRQEAWDAWIAAGIERTRAVIRKATGSAA